MGVFLASLVTMTVMWSPAVRLERTRVCVETHAIADETLWTAWCAEEVRAGAQMIIVNGADDDLDQALSLARQVSRQGLIGVAEPCGDVRADVVHIQSLGHCYRWPSVLMGCQVWTYDQARAAMTAGCSYCVVDVRMGELVKKMAAGDLGISWFVNGCETMDDLNRAIEKGARRAWIRAEDDVASFDARLRQVWNEDRADLSAVFDQFNQESQ